MTGEEITLIGVGNTMRKDDGLGQVLAQFIQEELLPEADVVHCSGEGTILIENLAGKETAFIFDAVRSGAAPGTIFRFDAKFDAVPVRFFNYSTHEFSVGEALELARVMQTLPEHLFVYGIEGKDFHSGSDISLEVRESFQRVRESVHSDLKQLGIWREGEIHA